MPIHRRLARPGSAALAALVLGLAAAAPAAADQPTRMVIPAQPISHFAAGEGCTFPVTAYKTPGARTTITEFSDGSTVYEVHSMHRTITNDLTGKTFVENLEYHDVERTDPSSGIIWGVTRGQSLNQFFPGDVGPYGIITQPVAYQIYGTQSWTWDPATGQTILLGYTGTLIDICAAIS